MAAVASFNHSARADDSDDNPEPISKAKRIVVIGDGQEAALTAYEISRSETIAKYQYQVYLI